MTIQFNNIYEFYQLPDEEAAKYVGSVIEELLNKWCIFFPIGMSNPYSNYNKKYGLIALSNIFDHWKNKQPYFRVYAKSPDDLDLGITYTNYENLSDLRQKVHDFMLSLPFESTSYREVS